MSRKLLIVEDESDFVIMLGTQAKCRGYDCIIDMTGADAVAKALTHKPVAILLDMNLPRISGLGLVQEIRRHRELMHLPIIILSALNQKEIVQEAMSRGANAYYTKSCPMNELFDVLSEYALNLKEDGGLSVSL